jgi:hypothetical protein
MSKVKSWILVLTCAAGLLPVACSQPQNRLRVSMAEAGFYPVDVARWVYVKAQQEYYATFDDATADLDVNYAGSISELPTFPADDAIQLTSFRVTWHNLANGGSIPSTTGALDEVIAADPTGKSQTKLSIVVVPAGTKETCSVLSALEGSPSPEDPVTYNGQVLAKGQVEIHGLDMKTNEDISTTIDFVAAFADYEEPNKDH